MRRPYSQYLTATNILVAINVVVFFLTGAGSSRSGLELYFTENPNFSYTQYLSHMFMHGSVNHLLFNMFGLWMFGKWLEKLWGAKRFVIFYLLSGIGAAVIYMFYNEWQFNGAIESVVANSAVTKDQLLATINGWCIGCFVWHFSGFCMDVSKLQNDVDILASPYCGKNICTRFDRFRFVFRVYWFYLIRR